MAFKRGFRRSRGIRGFRGKRGNRGAWFPTLGTGWTDGDSAYQDASFSGESGPVFDHRADGPLQIVFPVTKDFTQWSNSSTEPQGPSLRDIVEGNTWRLNRIVGQFHLHCSEQNSEVHIDAWPFVQVAAGFFVARSGDQDQTLPDLTFDEVDPLAVRNVQNSWIWRRTWILARPLSSNVGFSGTPCSNSDMAAESGMAIDSRVKRNVLREHRLWFAIGVIGWQGANETHPANTHAQPYISYNLDIRMHAQMKRARVSPTF